MLAIQPLQRHDGRIVQVVEVVVAEEQHVDGRQLLQLAGWLI